jgi:hypothetical protein
VLLFFRNIELNFTRMPDSRFQLFSYEHRWKRYESLYYMHISTFRENTSALCSSNLKMEAKCYSATFLSPCSFNLDGELQAPSDLPPGKEYMHISTFRENAIALLT